jgi:hypothetical protein
MLMVSQQKTITDNELSFTNICKHVNLGNAVIAVLTNLIRRLSKNGRMKVIVDRNIFVYHNKACCDLVY